MRKILGIFIVISGCTIGDKFGHFKPDFSPGPPTMVYKTKADYKNNVPVILSEDKSKIISYPAPSDLITNGVLAIPADLKKGYLLDNRGISSGVAFLKLTYDEYSKLKNTPSPDSLFTMILDKDPLTELCNCGNRNALKNPEKQINDLIRKGTLRTVCMVLK